MKSINSIVRTLNAHHMKTFAGFYGTKMGGRFFRARNHNGKLQVSDFDQWFDVLEDKMEFHDHNGESITL
jgi:hypothetical protein